MIHIRHIETSTRGEVSEDGRALGSLNTVDYGASKVFYAVAYCQCEASKRVMNDPTPSGAVERLRKHVRECTTMQSRDATPQRGFNGERSADDAREATGVGFTGALAEVVDP